MTYRITMIGESGEREVYDNPGADRPDIDGWDAAIRAAWVRLGRTGEGWVAARIEGPHGRTIHLRAEDKEARLAEIARRAEQGLSVGRNLEPLFDDTAREI